MVLAAMCSVRPQRLGHIQKIGLREVSERPDTNFTELAFMLLSGDTRTEQCHDETRSIFGLHLNIRPPKQTLRERRYNESAANSCMIL